MQLILTHNREPNRPLPALPRRLVNSIFVIQGGVRVGMVSSRLEGALPGGKAKPTPQPPKRVPVDVVTIAHRLGLYDRTTFYSLPRWARGLQLLDHSTPWSVPLSDLSRQYTRDLVLTSAWPLFVVRARRPCPLKRGQLARRSGNSQAWTSWDHFRMIVTGWFTSRCSSTLPLAARG